MNRRDYAAHVAWRDTPRARLAPAVIRAQAAAVRAGDAMRERAAMRERLARFTVCAVSVSLSVLLFGVF